MPTSIVFSCVSQFSSLEELEFSRKYAAFSFCPLRKPGKPLKVDFDPFRGVSQCWKASSAAKGMPRLQNPDL